MADCPIDQDDIGLDPDDLGSPSGLEQCREGYRSKSKVEEVEEDIDSKGSKEVEEVEEDIGGFWERIGG